MRNIIKRKIVRQFAYFRMALRSQEPASEDDAKMANDDRNSGMDEQFEQLRQAIARDIAAQFESRDERLRGDLDARFRDSEERLHDKLAARFEAREERLLKTISQDVARQLETAVKHLDDRAAIYMEDAKDLVKKAAEGYGGTLEAIDRRLGELATKWDTTIADHSLALQDHGKRIERLERR